MFQASSSSSPSSPSSSSSSTLHDLARVFNWQAVIARSASHPHEASYLGPDRLNALHHICNRRPGLEVVRALVEADPSQCDVQDVKGWTPLHYCCRFKANVAAVRCLLEAKYNNDHHNHNRSHPNQHQSKDNYYCDNNQIPSSTVYDDDDTATTNDNRNIEINWQEQVSSAIRARDFKGRTPLYYAVRYEAPDEVVRLLIMAYPDAVKQRDHQGVSPVSFIWNSFASSFVGRRSVQDAIQSLSRMQTFEERHHYQMKDKLYRKWNYVMDILKLAWKASHHRLQNTHDVGRHDDWLPLHALSTCSCHVSLWELAVAMYPEQASVVDNSTGRLPLHCVAASHDIPNEEFLIMLQSLMDIFPDAARALDVWGRSPLSIAVQDKGWMDGLSDLYEFYPEAIKIPDGQGKLPIHIAAKADCAQPITVVKLLEHYSEGLGQADHEGKLPLHLAVESLPDDFQNKYLIIYQAYPDAIKVKDKQNGWLPLHTACANPDVTTTVIRGLLSQYKNGAKVLDRYNKTPFMIAAENGKSWENTLQYLFEVYPDAIKMRNIDGFLPIHAMAMTATEEMSSCWHLEVLSTMFKLSTLDPSCFER